MKDFITSSNYFLLCIDNRITQLFKETCLGIQYWRQHKHIKCYKCREYGHLAKQCDQICKKCGNYHPSLPVCMTHMEELLEEIITILEKNKKTPYERYVEIKKKMEDFSEEQDEKYLNEQIEATMKDEIKQNEIERTDSFEINKKINNKESDKRKMENYKITNMEPINFGKMLIREQRFGNLVPSLKTEISYQYEYEESKWFSWIFAKGDYTLDQNSYDIKGTLKIEQDNNSYWFYGNKEKKEQEEEERKRKEKKEEEERQKYGAMNKKYKSKSKRKDKREEKEEPRITLRVKEEKLLDKNYYVRTPQNKKELIRSLMKDEDEYNKKKMKQLKRLREKKLYKIEEKFYELQNHINKDKEINKLLKQIEVLKDKREKLKDDCREIQEEKHRRIENISKAKEIGYSIINNAHEKADEIKGKAYEHYKNRGLRRRYRKRKNEKDYMGEQENLDYWEEREAMEQEELRKDNEDDEECDINP